MKTAYDIRVEQNRSAKEKQTRMITVFSNKVEEAVTEASKDGMHQISVVVPDSLVASIVPVAMGYEKLGYRVKIEKEKGWLGRGVYKGPLTYLTLGW